MKINKLQTSHKFGTFTGVFIPSILTIFGPIMFMRFNFVIGNIGIINTFIVLIAAQSITLCTAFSLAAISTNTQVHEGGAYFLISRSLGAGFGGAIGITLFFAQALSVPFYIIGFTEALLGTLPHLTPMYLWIALVTCIVLFLLTWSGAKWAIKAQTFIFVILILSILVFMFGAAGKMNLTNLIANRNAVKGVPIFIMFAIFFPAVTGIMAGVNMSGDLKNPGHSVTVGTFYAIGIATVVYAVEIFICGSAFSRDILINHPFMSLVDNAVFGLGFLVVLGVFCATLSSAIGSFLGAPRILRALSKDKIIPGLLPFSKRSLSSSEPRRALLLTLIISIAVLTWAGLQITDHTGKDPLNVIAEIVSMFFLYTYGMINMAAFVESFGGNPSFRPKFKYFHWSIALAGTVICIILSFLISLSAAIIAMIFFTLIFLIARRQELTQSFGDARRGFVYSRIRNNLIKLSAMPFNPKNWRPSIAVLTGNLDERKDRLSMLKFAVNFEGHKGVVSVVEFIEGKFSKLKTEREEKITRLNDFLIFNNFYSVFPEVVVSKSFDEGLSNFLQAHSIGPIKPNIIILGCPTNRFRKKPFIRHLNMISDLDKSFIIFKKPDNIDDPIIPFGKYIDIWWRGRKNGSLMLILAYILVSNPLWKDISIRIIRIVDKAQYFTNAKKDLDNMISESRIPASAKVIISEDFSVTLQQTSKDSAAVFMGTNVPNIENTDGFFKIIENNTINMPPVFYIYSSGDADLLA
ncbi:MAG TPA: amino acid permease [Victivallales bacterium]|nr:amino acid permease [Victivallales bacterium]